MSHSKGAPIMSDEDYDTLKNELRMRGSIVSAQVGVFDGVYVFDGAQTVVGRIGVHMMP
jgi:hypothetical protein